MNEENESPQTQVSRRRLLAAAGFTATAAAAASVVGSGSAQAAEARSAALTRRGVGDPTLTPNVEGLHLQFGADASREAVVSWSTLQPVKRPQVFLGRPDGAYERALTGQTRTYTDAKSGKVVYAHHVRVNSLSPDREYLYAAVHDGAQPEFGSFRTGRAAGRPLPSPASVTRARRRWASGTPRQPG